MGIALIAFLFMALVGQCSAPMLPPFSLMKRKRQDTSGRSWGSRRRELPSDQY